MTTASRLLLALGLAFATVLAGPSPAPAQDGETVTRALETVSVDTAHYRPGHGVTAALPTSARAFGVDGGPYDNSQFLLFDLNGDGRITPETDGVALKKFPFVVPLPKKLLLPAGQGRVQVEGETLTLEWDDLEVPAEVRRQASFLTNLRIRAAARPVMLSDSASRHARWHCDYLEKNKTGEGLASLSVHSEREGAPGYTEEGYRAARNSVVAQGHDTYDDALWAWYRTPFHGQVLTDPTLRVAGVAHRNGTSLLYPVASEGPERAYVFPPDGATGMPRKFNPGGETPDPRPRPGTFGTPIYMYVPPTSDVQRSAAMVALYEGETEKTVTEIIRSQNDSLQERLMSGSSVDKTVSSPTSPAKSVLRAYDKGYIPAPNNYNVIVYTPEETLAPDTEYSVLLSPQDRSWSFRTRAARPDEKEAAPAQKALQGETGGHYGAYQANPGHTGIFDTTVTASAPSVAWSDDKPGRIDGSPVVFSGTVFVGTRNNRIHALQAGTGTTAWTQRLSRGGFIRATPLLSSQAGDYLYIGTRSGTLYALGAVDGHFEWHLETHGPIRTTATALGPNVVAASTDDTLRSVHSEQGTAERFASTGDLEGAPAAAGRHLYVGTLDGQVHAFAAYGPDRGETLWTTELPGELKGAVTAHEEVVYAASRAGHVTALDHETGTEQWQFSAEGGVARSVALYCGRAHQTQFGRCRAGDPSEGRDATESVLVTDETGRVYAVDADDGTEQWRTQLEGSLTAPVVAGETVLVGSETGRLYALDARTGETRWTHRAGGPIRSAPSVAGGRVFVAAGGSVVALE
jgi:outer membrane protein assembly factor BamB